MKENVFLAVFAVIWMIVTLATVVVSFAQDESLENVTTINGKVVPGGSVFSQEFAIYGKRYLLKMDASAKELACLTIKGQFVCIGWDDCVKFTFFPIDSQTQQSPFDAIGFSSNEKKYPSGVVYHIVSCPLED